MIRIEIFNVEKVVAHFGEVGARVQSAMVSTLNAWAAELVSYIKEVKLSGGTPLHRRSGDLSASVHPVATTLPAGYSAGAGGGAGLPYALIHELGGLIPAHQVVVKNALALSIKLPTGIIFRHSANIPEIVMPERSYMRSSLRERGPDGIAQLRLAVREAVIG